MRPVRLLSLAVLVLASPWAPSVLMAQAPSPPRFVDAWVGGPLDSIYNAEYARVQETCRGQTDACYASALDTSAVRLTAVYGEPGATSAAGWIAARLRPNGRWPQAGLVFEGVDGSVVPLIDELGDWGYGTTLDLVDAREGWIRPWLLDGADAQWLSTEGGRGFGVVEGPYGLDGRLWRLPAIPADGAGGEALPAGVYMVLAVEGGAAHVRAELPQDMDCDGTADAASVGPGPTTHRIPLAALLDGQGRSAIEPAYPKGC